MNALILAMGVLALSSAAILIRAADAPALATAFYRLVLSAGLLGAVAAPGGRAAWRALPWRAVLAAGAALALHFWAWMQSLELTSVASSTLFVTTTPLWIGLAAPWIPTEERLASRAWLGVLVAFAGAVVVATGASGGRVDPLGVGLATIGAWCMAAYLLIGRSARQRVDVAPYAAATTAVAAAVTGAIASLSDTPLGGFDRSTWLAFGALAVIPHGIGHTAVLRSVRFTGAAVVAIAVLFEPVGAAVLAAVFLDEAPGPFEAVGGALLLLGVAIVVRSRSTPQRFT